MPSRVIRESALNSPTLAKLSHGAERLFWRLTIIADDAGRFDAHPTVVKARCFPLLVDTLKTADVVFAQWESLLCKSFKEAGMANKDAAQIAVMTISAFEGVAAMCRSRRSVHPLDAVSAQLESTIAAAIANGKNR